MKDNFENSQENILQNIAEDLSNISGTCTEIKESQLNCATADDLNNMGTTITSAVTEKVDEMQTSIETQTQTVSEIGSNLTTEVNDLKTEITNRIDDFTANPPVQKIEKAIRIAPESWQVYLAMFIAVFTFIFFGATTIWQESRIEKARISDIKYHYILMHGGVGSEGLDSIESWFRDPERVKHIEKEVKDYEDRVQETARALDQKQRLEEKINELNSKQIPNPTENESIQQHQPTPLPCKNHLWPQGYTRDCHNSQRGAAYRPLSRKRPTTQRSLRRHREISRRQLRHSGSQTALSGLHQWSHSYIRRCNVCCIARNPNSHKRSCTSPRQRVAARRSHLDQRCRMARRRAEKVHQLPHEALPQASHPAPRFRLLQRLIGLPLAQQEP